MLRSSLIRFGAGFIAVTAAAIACRQGDPSIEPKTPPNSPIPTKIERPDDRPSSPPSLSNAVPDGGATR
jgi:hypothetical protein